MQSHKIETSQHEILFLRSMIEITMQTYSVPLEKKIRVKLLEGDQIVWLLLANMKKVL